MKATEVKVGDWVMVDRGDHVGHVKVMELRSGDAIMVGGGTRWRVFRGEDDELCRKMGADEVTALGLE
jgi:hypothetical protein